MRDLAILGDFLYDVSKYGELAPNTEWRPSARLGNAELGTRQVAEIRAMAIIPPVVIDQDAGTRTAQELRDVYLVLDDDYSLQPFMNLSGTDTTLMTPDPRKVEHGKVIYFGDSIVDVVRQGQPTVNQLVRAAIPRYRQQVRVVARAGATPITQNFRIILLGHVYYEEELPLLLDSRVLSGRVQIRDRARGVELAFDKGEIPIDFENWQRLPGGSRQSKPIIHPFWRHARNAQPTTINTPYQFRFETGGVASSHEELWFPYDRSSYDKAILLRGLGVRYAPNLAYAYIHNTAGGKHEIYPRNKVKIDAEWNPLHFGLLPFVDPTQVQYRPIPRLDYLIYQDEIYVAIQDNGKAPVAANSVHVAVNGVIFDGLGGDGGRVPAGRTITAT